MLCRNRKVMGVFRSGNPEFVAATFVSLLVIALNGYFLYTFFNCIFLILIFHFVGCSFVS